MPAVQDEGGYNQGWTGGRSLQLRTERRCDLMMTKMAGGRSGEILEIGCGRGEIACRLASQTEMNVLGIDRSDRFVEIAQQNASGSNAHFEVADFRRPATLLEHRFAYVVGNGILHHLYQELPASLLAMRKLLVEDGRLIFLEPNLHNPYVYLIFTRPRLRRMAKLEPDEMAFTRKFVMDKLEKAGFSDIEVEYRDFLLPVVPDWMIQPLVRLGDIAERTPGLKHLAQSLFISATAS